MALCAVCRPAHGIYSRICKLDITLVLTMSLMIFICHVLIACCHWSQGPSSHIWEGKREEEKTLSFISSLSYHSQLSLSHNNCDILTITQTEMLLFSDVVMWLFMSQVTLSQFFIAHALCLQMAGGIFTNLDNLFNVDCSNVHPLVCHLCHEQYQTPCLLDCYHIFCARCLSGRTNDSRLSCPLCG